MKRQSVFTLVLAFLMIGGQVPGAEAGNLAQGPGPRSVTAPMPDMAAAATWVVTFTDVAAEMNAAAPGCGTAVAWGDYDDDGDPDLYIVNLGPGGGGQANVLLRNDGSTFSDVTAAAGVGDAGPGVAAAWADLDNDGDLDLFVSNRPGNNALFFNDGAGHFQNIGVAAGVADAGGYGEGVAWADDDRDGLVDLYVANYTWAAPPYAPNRLFRNLDGFHFQDVAAAAGVADTGNGEGIAWADFDNDGDLDLYIANAGGMNALYQRQGDGTFANVTTQMHVPGGPGSSYGAAWGDYDNDGWLDLYVAQQGANKLYRNLGGTDFADVTDQAGVGGGSDRWSLGCAWGDYDNDGDLDLHVANAAIAGYDPADILFSNEGGNPVTFSDVTALAGVTNTLDARGNAWGDFDNDGDLDLYVVNQGTGQPNRLFRNNGSPAHWLQVRLIGSISNRAAIGARVTVTSDRSQMREIGGGSGFASQDSLPAEFGLGNWDEAVDLAVRWPSGIESFHPGVMADCIITLTEPAPDLFGAVKTASTEAALPGEVLTYTLVVSNTGDWTAPAGITDTLPPGLMWIGYLTATLGTPAWDPVGRQVLWSGVISPGVAVSLTYRAMIRVGLVPGTLITNAATVDDGYRPPFDTPPVTVTVLCQEVGGVGFGYTPTEPLVGQVVTFTAEATGTLPLTFTWNLGDGAIGSGATVSHVYTAASNYRVTLVAANPCSQEVVTQTITVEMPVWRIYLPLVMRDIP